MGVNSKLHIPIVLIQEQVASLYWAGPWAGMDAVGKKEIFMNLCISESQLQPATSQSQLRRFIIIFENTYSGLINKGK